MRDGVASDHEAGSLAGQLVEQEAPKRVDVAARSGAGGVERTAAEVEPRAQREESLGFDGMLLAVDALAPRGALTAPRERVRLVI